MENIKFIWTDHKAQKNLEKHKISFEEAKTVFSDDSARLIFDPDHSDDEERFLLLGLSHKLKVLTVVHCYKDSDSIIRIISARKSTKKEEKQYKEFLS